MTGIISPDPNGAASLYRAMRITYRDDGQVRNREFGTTTTQANLDSMTVKQHVDTLYDANSRPNVIRAYERLGDQQHDGL